MVIARIAGIPVRVDWSWLLVFAFFVWTLGQPVGPFANLSPPWRLLAASVTILALFACVIAHETAHALVARHYGHTVREIELFVFGGVSRIDSTGSTPRQEASIAIAGPLVSVAAGLLFGFIATLFAQNSTALRAFGYLAFINIALAVFNLLPSYPLDGARVVHALAWRLTGRRRQATQIVAAISSVTGVALIAVSIMLFFAGYVTSGVWTAFVAWFIMRAARAEAGNELYVSPLATTTCADVADPPPESLQPDTTCAQALDHMIITRRRALPVAIGSNLLGLITLSDFAKIDGRDPAHVYATAIMTRAAELISVRPETPALEGFKRLADSKHGQLPVLDDRGELRGFISSETFHRALSFAQEEQSVVPSALQTP